MKMKTTARDRVVRMTLLALLVAMAYLCVLIFRIPVVSFLRYEPKDVILALTGILLGPIEGVAAAVIVSLIEMMTPSDTGLWGLLMNVLASVAFLLPAAILYRIRRTLASALTGIFLGVLFSTAMMMLWNYLITPIYMGVPREAVAEMLLPMFLPFNLLKDGLNAALSMLLYVPLLPALQKARVLPNVYAAPATEHSTGRMVLAAVLMALIAAVCVYVTWFSGWVFT